MKIQERQSSPRTTSTSVFSVCFTFLPLHPKASSRSPYPVADHATAYDKTTDTTQPLERNGRKTLTTVQGLPKKFDQKKILKVIKKKFGKLASQMAVLDKD
jgi:hypothetical protein